MNEKDLLSILADIKIRTLDGGEHYILEEGAETILAKLVSLGWGDVAQAREDMLVELVEWLCKHGEVNHVSYFGKATGEWREHNCSGKVEVDEEGSKKWACDVYDKECPLCQLVALALACKERGK